jgi:hypothetical protein
MAKMKKGKEAKGKEAEVDRADVTPRGKIMNRRNHVQQYIMRKL